MPIYTYRCANCGWEADMLKRDWKDGMSFVGSPCPKCGKKIVMLPSNSSFILKGGGWYKKPPKEEKSGSDV